MKKFLFVMLILAVLGGVVFFLGWAQLTVPPGSYGVMRSKTHGLEERVIEGGDFRWYWYKAIPTNAAVSVFTLGPVKHRIGSTGSLSSGQVYAALAGLEADFSWEIAGDIVFSLRPGILPVFTTRENIGDDAGLRAAERDLAGRIESRVLERLKAYADSGEDGKLETLAVTGSLPELDRAVREGFPEIENFSCAVRVARYPDYALYRAARGLYEEFMAKQSELLRPAVGKEAETRVEVRLRLDELSRYGELLTRYPILLQYLALEKGIAPAPENRPER
jgi:hypothetical protein